MSKSQDVEGKQNVLEHLNGQYLSLSVSYHVPMTEMSLLKLG